MTKPSVQDTDAWTWWRFRLVRSRHRGFNRSTTWRLFVGWGATWPGVTALELTWRHRDREGGRW